MRSKVSEVMVGLFVILAGIALFFSAFQASALSFSNPEDTFQIEAVFDNIAGLREKAPVRMAGVRIGKVVSITLDPASYRARVIMELGQSIAVPDDSVASVLTEGLLGAQYVGISPGFSDGMLASGGHLEQTHSAMILENLIGQFMLNASKEK